MRQRSWTYREEKNLIKLYPSGNIAAVAKKLGRTIPAIKSYAKKINLHRARRYKHWTVKENKEFDKLYPTTRSKILAKKFGCSTISIYQNANRRGIKKDPLWLKRQNQELGRRVMNLPAMLKNRFRKGVILPHQHVSKKGEKHKGSEKGWFKKGHLPHNTKHDGAITIRYHKTGRTGKMRPYKYIRLRLGKWKEYHLYLWEKKHGKVPKGHRVMFRDNDSMNCTLRNLVLRTEQEAIDQTRQSDEFIASLMAQRRSRRYGFKPDERLKRELLKHPELIHAKRQQIKLQKILREKV